HSSDTPGFRTLHILAADDTGTSPASPRTLRERLTWEASTGKYHLHHSTTADGTSNRDMLLFIPHGWLQHAASESKERSTDRHHAPTEYAAWIKYMPEIHQLVNTFMDGKDVDKNII